MSISMLKLYCIVLYVTFFCTVVPFRYPPILPLILKITYFELLEKQNHVINMYLPI